jgi:hypothetical protein
LDQWRCGIRLPRFRYAGAAKVASRQYPPRKALQWLGPSRALLLAKCRDPSP